MALLASILGTIVFAAVILATALGSEEPARPLFPPSEAFAVDQLDRIRNIRDRVSEVRGLPVAKDIREGTINRDVLDEFFTGSFDALLQRSGEDLDAQARAFKLLGLIGQDFDLVAAYRESGIDGLSGIYVPEEKRMLVLADQVGVAQEFTIAHEYVHSFQDARFDFDALQQRGMRDEEGEMAATIPCVYEGDASLAAVVYMNGRYGREWITQARQEAVAGTPSSAASGGLPPALQRYLAFNYNECSLFAAGVFARRGWAGIDELYAKPPTTTEQILHVEKYFDGEGAIAQKTRDLRAVLGPGWKRRDGWAFGEFDVLNHLLSAGVLPMQAYKAAAGWAGGRLEIYASTRRESDDAVVNIVLQWDSEADWNEFKSALERAYAGRNAAFFYGEETSGWGRLGANGFAVWGRSGLQVELVFASDELVLKRVEASILP